MDDLEAELAAAAEIPTDEKLSDLRDAVRTHLLRHQRIQRIEAMLSILKQRLREEAERTLPERFAKLGIGSFTFGPDAILEVHPFSSARILEEKKEAAFKWLSEAGFGDLIKNEVTASFGRGEDKLAQALFERLVAEGRTAMNRRGVHPQTLNAFVRNQLRTGGPLDREVIEVHAGTVVQLKLPKDVTLDQILEGEEDE